MNLQHGDNLMELNIDFNPLQGHVAYEEAYKAFLPPAPLNRWVQSFWQLNVPSGGFSYHSIPDNSVDWIINTNCFEDNFVVPPFLSPTVFEMTGPVSYFGIRFRLLGHQGLISTPIGEWGFSDVVNARDVLPSHVIYAVFESIKKTARFHRRCNNVSAILLSIVKHSVIDPRVARYILYCCKNMASSINLSDKQCSEFGVSSRQLRRLSQLHLGLCPKDFAKVLRFQKLLSSLSMGHHKTAWLDHYYDQSHYIREFKRLSGLTPTKFVNSSVLYNHHSSI